ncbi:MAG: carboxypeptidase regulatory-like domain-containing protein [Acidobacteria bacterium]|nr:carboxypeptidase regulatory-like domain-containing protein [Acidobacteriota bacterium]MCI0628045.1 carboxypeptidase regulatory-like domain-containing protein [Acidobacteriota bacterium]MCI0718051.1 carboxypeptidase regulatory-like domain-containing protein [Acidobacteriota bacterium]
MKNLRMFLWLWMSLLWISPEVILAQTAQITGRITDTTGGVVQGVEIKVTQIDTGIHRDASSNDEGYFTVPLLQPGNYRITAEMAGFKTVSRSGIKLNVDQVARIDLVLEVGEVTERIEVSAAAPLLDSETSAVGQVIDNKRVVELPLNGRNFVQLATLSPGTTTRGNSAFTSEPEVNINGNRGGAAGFLIDGAENYEQNAQTVMISPSIETIQEFRVQSGTFSAADGRQAGIISVVTKTGTNQFRGNVFEFLRNENLDARNFFNPDKEPEPLKRNQFGGTLGGPILKERLFFFTAYEGIRERRGTVRNSLVPSQAQRAGNLSGLPPIFDPATTNTSTRTRQPFQDNLIPTARLNPTALRLLEFIPLPNSPGDRFISSLTNQVRVDQYNFRVDHRLTDKDSYFVRYTHNHRFSKLPGPFPVVGGDDQDVFSGNGIISYTRTFSPTLINEFRFTASRFNLDFDTFSRDLQIIDPLGIQGLEGRKRESIEGFPILNVTGYGNFGDIGIRPLQQRFNTFNWIDTLTWIKGSHTLRLGVDIRRFQRAAFNGINARGNFSFTGTLTQDPSRPGGTGSGLADFLLGLPNSAGRNFPRLRQQMFWTNISSFLQDDWKISPKLTLNLGLRHEFNGQPLEKFDRIGSFDLATGKPISACNASKEIRQDAFIFFNQSELDFLGVTCAETLGFPARTLRKNQYRSFAPRVGFAYDPFGSGRTVFRGGYGIFYTLVGGNLSAQNIGSVPFFRGETFVTDPLLPTLTLNNAFPAGPTALPVPEIFAFESDFKDGYVQEWSFNIQRQMGRDTVVEVGYVGNKGTHLDMSYQANRPLPGSGAIQPRRPYPKFSNIQFNTTVGYSNYNALQARLERRFSEGLTFLTAYTYAKAMAMTAESQDPRNLAAGKGLAAFDIPHRFVMSSVYELPFGKGRPWLNRGGLLNGFLGGWQLGAIVALQSGLPFTPTTGRDLANIGTTTLPNRLASGQLENPTIDRWFDPSAFANPAAFTFGTSGVNILRADGFQNLDVSLSKNLSLGESRYIQIRSEFFNAFNHPNFGAPNANINQPAQVGRVFSADDPRIIQLALKVFF